MPPNSELKRNLYFILSFHTQSNVTYIWAYNKSSLRLWEEKKLKTEKVKRMWREPSSFNNEWSFWKDHGFPAFASFLFSCILHSIFNLHTVRYTLLCSTFYEFWPLCRVVSTLPQLRDNRVCVQILLHSALLIGKPLSAILTAHPPVGLLIWSVWSLPLAFLIWLLTTTSSVQALTHVFLLHGNQGCLTTHVKIRFSNLLLRKRAVSASVSIPVILSSVASGSPKNTNYWLIARTCLAMAYPCPG